MSRPSVFHSFWFGMAWPFGRRRPAGVHVGWPQPGKIWTTLLGKGRGHHAIPTRLAKEALGPGASGLAAARALSHALMHNKGCWSLATRMAVPLCRTQNNT